MDYFTFLELVCLSALFFFIGKVYAAKEVPGKSSSKDYSQLRQDYDGDEENELPLVSKAEKVTKGGSELDSKQIDRLMREVEDMKSREKKHMAEIQLLKNKLKGAEKSSPVQKETKPSKQDSEDSNHLLHEEIGNYITPDDNDANEVIDEDQLSKEIEQEMRSHNLT